jgi:hypothetical protein
MSNATEEQEDKELKEMEDQLLAAEAAVKQAAPPPEPSPAPAPSPAPEATPSDEPSVTQTQSTPEKPTQDDPMEWAKKKGLKTPEDIVRALQQKEQEFHKRNQAGHPGYQDIEGAQPPPPQPQWRPQPVYPQQPNYGYQPQPQFDARRLASQYDLQPEDFEKVARVSADMTRAGLEQLQTQFNQKLEAIERHNSRQNELMSLMQDPAFRDETVQREMHSVLDADPAIFQRERNPNVYAYRMALGNLYRKQLQQGFVPAQTNRPPVTAGGGNGSANTAPQKITDSVFNSWTDAEQDAYMKSNGRVVPKR